MDVPQFTISPPKPPVNGCCTEATIVSDVPVPAVSTRSTTLCWAGSWRVAGATHVHSPSLRTRAWAPRRGLGHWARPGRQAPGTSSPLSAEDVLLRGGERPHQASVGPAGWTSALQQQQGGGVCAGADGHGQRAASSSCWQLANWVAGAGKGGIRPRTSGVGRPGCKGGHRGSSGKHLWERPQKSPPGALGWTCRSQQPLGGLGHQRMATSPWRLGDPQC